MARKNQKDKYNVIYVERCTQQLAEFATKELAEKFIQKFSTESENNPDNWIDYVFKGRKLNLSEKVVWEIIE